MIVIHLSLADSETVLIKWDDGHESRIPLRTLRDACPCAGCKGETVLLHSYAPVDHPTAPGAYTLSGAHPVGSYALQLRWGDGHETGIYTWDHLRSVCPCADCQRR
ncbi:MAG: DUF971 domain-containing protein [Bacteroidetes bacterium]|jgi:DUF971 family protein|nr:DUF971 domain-containing protein [Bacteroidota bacterium]